MSYSLEDPGVLSVVMERFQKQRLPRILDIKELVEKGQTLNDNDIAFLEEVFEDTRQYQGFVNQHPEFQALYARVVHLYEQITERALENEKASN
jgi:hypothetical protein